MFTYLLTGRLGGIGEALADLYIVLFCFLGIVRSGWWLSIREPLVVLTRSPLFLPCSGLPCSVLFGSSGLVPWFGSAGVAWRSSCMYVRMLCAAYTGRVRSRSGGRYVTCMHDIISPGGFHPGLCLSFLFFLFFLYKGMGGYGTFLVCFVVLGHVISLFRVPGFLIANFVLLFVLRLYLYCIVLYCVSLVVCLF
ncbi:hypothetical protein F4861DRAFT_182411 [Xylaria intraflava]|nr:hypothetical protein F4861DRAFT_182411 [Xylaria intraflava]